MSLIPIQKSKFIVICTYLTFAEILDANPGYSPEKKEDNIIR